jgi:hypothetical protein
LQTYTHALIGALASYYIAPANYYVLSASVTAAVLPDVPSFIKLIKDRITGSEPFINQSKEFILVKEIFHSIPLFSLLYLLVISFAFIQTDFSFPVVWIMTLLGVFLVNAIMHQLNDALTHCGQEFKKDDQTCLWPLKVRLSDYIGFWEYRKRPGCLVPKLPELVIDIVLIIWIILLLL